MARCVATTKKGTQCKREAAGESEYCSRHGAERIQSSSLQPQPNPSTSQPQPPDVELGQPVTVPPAQPEEVEKQPQLTGLQPEPQGEEPRVDPATALQAPAHPESTPVLPPAPVNEGARAKARPRRYQEVQALMQQIMERWTGVFASAAAEVKPLKRGIRYDIAAHIAGTSPYVVGQAIAQWQRMRAVAYQSALVRGGPRYGLEGQAIGEVTPEEQERARQELKAVYARRRAKGQARDHESAASPTSSPE